MKLLILTQKVDINDDVLGFFHGWIEEFAKHCEKVTVICLFKGQYNLPDNVKVLSLGKEGMRTAQNSCERAHANFFSRKLDNVYMRGMYLFRFYKYIWQERKNYDAVFVHMNPEYVVAGGIFWKLLGKKIGLWYVHKQVNLKLRIAEWFSDIIFTASKESCQVESKKIMIVGHGVDLSRFKSQGLKVKGNGKFKIIYVGRISPIKDQKLLIAATDILVRQKKIKDFEVDFIGGPIMEGDREYLLELKKMADELGISHQINFIGSISNKEIIRHYHEADLSINLCPTGGLDKAVLESIACEIPVIVLNKSFLSLLGYYSRNLALEKNDPLQLAEKIIGVMNLDQIYLQKMKNDLRTKIEKNYSLEIIIGKISQKLSLKT